MRDEGGMHMLEDKDAIVGEVGLNASITGFELRAVELFAGGGAMAMGLIKSGFTVDALVEICPLAVGVMRMNVATGALKVSEDAIIKGAVEDQDWSMHKGIMLLTGGPPCQSVARNGNGDGFDDERDRWDETIAIVHETMPPAFMFEHVSGFVETKHREGRERILDGLRSGAPGSPGYTLVWKLVNLADYGSAQYRRRVILMGFRNDLFPHMRHKGRPDLLGLDASLYDHTDPLGVFPKRTHTEDRLRWEKWVSGVYWARHGLAGPPDQSDMPEEVRVREGRSCLKVLTWLGDLAHAGIDPVGRPYPEKPEEKGQKPWVTVRDVTWDLGFPNGINDHVFRSGAGQYKGHCGSAYDMPGKALKSGDHANPGGENSCWFDDGYRYFSVREAARLQGMPDNYVFNVTKTQKGPKRKGCKGLPWQIAVRQLGNAVPVNVAEFFSGWMLEQFAIAGLTGQAPLAGEEEAA
jgi:DNA (cytosine-5)-methyltransferase 1